MTRRLRWIPVYVLCAGVAACGGDDDDDDVSDAGGSDGAGSDGAGSDGAGGDPCLVNGGEDCFELPTMALALPAGAPNLDCGPFAPAESTEDIMVSGTVRDYATGNPIVGATVDISYTFDWANPDATATSMDMGAVSLTLPQPVPNFLWGCVEATDAVRQCTSFLFDIMDTTITNAGFGSVSISTRDTVAGLIGENVTADSTYVAGGALDCDGAGLLNAIGTLSSTSSHGTGAAPTFIPGTRVYYFQGTPALPVRRSTATSTTATSNVFIVYGATPSDTTPVFVQVWGFKDAAAVAMGEAGLSLIGELEVRAPTGTVVVTGVPPSEGP